MAVVLGLCAVNISAATAESGFDGIWVGTESAMYQEMNGMLKSEPYKQSRPARIVIAQNGTLLGVDTGSADTTTFAALETQSFSRKANGQDNLLCQRTVRR